MIYLAFDALCFLSLAAMRLRRAAWAYLLCPLVIIETYVGLHVDLVGAALMAAAWWSLTGRRYRAAFALLALAVLVKPVPIVLLPVFLVVLLRNEPRRVGAAVQAALVFLSYVVRIAYLESGLWTERTIVRLFEYVPYALILLAERLHYSHVPSA